MAKVLIFIQNNGIYDIEQLADKIKDIHEQFYDVSNKIKSTNRRIDTLTQHLAHWEIYKQNKACYEKYKKLPQNKTDAFYDKHSEEIQMFEEARGYLKDVMNGRTDIPAKAWKKEVLKLTEEKFALCDKFYRLREDVKNVEVLRRGAENIMRENIPERNITKSKGVTH